MKAFIEGLRKKNALVLDTETTGLDNRAEVLQIAITSLNGVEIFNSLVKPMRVQRWDEAMRVHGISPNQVKDAPTIGDLAEQLKEIMAGRTVAIYNAKFDMRLLWQSIEAGKAGERFRWLQNLDAVCVMEAYAAYWGERNYRYGGYRWQSLGNACRQQGVRIVGAHDALGDAKMTAALMRAIADKAG